MNLRKYITSEKGIFFTISFLIWCYLWVRAYFVPMAHDEIATFFYYVDSFRFIPYYAHMDANNHVLNSFLSWITYQLFGNSPLALRIPNLLAFPIFALFTFKIAGEIKTIAFRWFFLLTLLFTHYFIEFLALSRGYGMSMAFLLGAIFYLIKIFKGNFSIKAYTFCLLFILLAVAANLTLINTYLIIIGLLFFILFFNTAIAFKEKLKRIALIILLGIIPLTLSAKYAFDLNAHGNLYAGSQEGFIRLTIRTLIELLTGYNSIILAYVFIILTAILFIFFIILLVKNRTINFITNYKNIYFYLLILNIAATLFLGKVLKINYPEDRIGMYFYPLFVGCLIFTTEQFFILFKKKIILLLLLPLVFFPIHFILKINLSYTFCYKTDMLPQNFYDKVYKDYKPGQFPPTIGSEYFRHFCWSYMDYRNGGKLSQIYSSKYPGIETDFVISEKNDLPIFAAYYDSISYYKINDRYLLKRKQPLSKQFLADFITKEAHTTSEEFYSIAKGSADTLKGEMLHFTYKITLACKTKPFNAWVVVTILNKEGDNIRYEYISLNWLRRNWDGEKDNFMNTTFIDKLPKTADNFICYIWNMDKVSYTIKDVNVGVYKVATNGGSH